MAPRRVDDHADGRESLRFYAAVSPARSVEPLTQYAETDPGQVDLD